MILVKRDGMTYTNPPIVFWQRKVKPLTKVQRSVDARIVRLSYRINPTR